MVSTKKSIGNVTLAGIFAAATLAAAVPAFASTQTVVWKFYSGNANPGTKLGTTATFTGTPDVPNYGPGVITAYGEQATATTTSTKSYTYYYPSGYKQTGSSLGSPVYASSATNLFDKTAGGSENGLGLANYGDYEIGDASATTSSASYMGGYDNNGWYHSNEYKTVKTSTTRYTGMIQLDLSNLLSLATSSGAYIKIGSLSSSSEDVAVFSGSNTLGDLGTPITSLSYTTTTSGVGSETLSLSDLTDPSTHQYYSYLNISVAKPGQSVLLSTLSLTFNTNNGGPSAAPVPATAGLTLAGAMGMGMLLLARRRRSML